MNDSVMRNELLEIDEARFRNRATDGRNLSRLSSSCSGPTGSEPRPRLGFASSTAARDVDGISKTLDALRDDLERHKSQVTRVLADHEEEHAKLHAELANTKTRLACAERALGERHREGR